MPRCEIMSALSTLHSPAELKNAKLKIAGCGGKSLCLWRGASLVLALAQMVRCGDLRDERELEATKMSLNMVCPCDACAPHEAPGVLGALFDIFQPN